MSPSGAYAFLVDPSDMYGRFGATYRLIKNGKEVWAAEHEFTLWGAGLTNDGVVAGYGYTQGPDGFVVGTDGRGRFHVVIIGRDGEFVLNEKMDRERERGWFGVPDPTAQGVVVNDPCDRLFVRVLDQHTDSGPKTEDWWTYELSSGKQCETFKPHDLMEGADYWWGIADAAPVGGTPLTLVHWYHTKKGDDGSRDRGATFSLIDVNGNPVWRVSFEGDYMIEDRREPQWSLLRYTWDQGAILDVTQRSQFDVLCIVEAARVTYAVEKKENVWTVTEKKRVPFGIPGNSTVDVESLPDVPLPSLGTYQLHTAESEEAPIRNVIDFASDKSGRTFFLRGDWPEPAAFVAVDQKGVISKTIPLEPTESEFLQRPMRMTWIGRERFVITRAGPPKPDKASGWIIDLKTDEHVIVPDLLGATCGAVDGSNGEGFAVLGHLALDGADSSLHRFGLSGNLMWSIEEHSDESIGFYNPDDVAVFSDGRVATVGSVTDRVHIFDRNGRLQQVFDLGEKDDEDDHHYATHVSADGRGNLIVRDFAKEKRFQVFNKDGQRTSQFQPQYPDGRVFTAHAGIKVAPNGRMWTTDGHSLLRLDDKGVVDLVLGHPPDPSELEHIGGITVDGMGRIYAIARRTGAVHVFDSAGRFLHVCDTDPSDFSRDVYWAPMTVDDGGRLFLGLPSESRSPDDKHEYVRYAPNGKREDKVTFGIDWLHEDWIAQPKTGRFWILGRRNVYLVGRNGEFVRELKRRPDRGWLEAPGAASVSPDGSIAVIAGQRNPHGIIKPGSLTVNVFDPDGEPQTMHRLPGILGEFPRIAYDGSRLIVTGRQTGILLDNAGTPIRKFSLPEGGHDNALWHPFIVAGGRELLLSDGIQPILHRFVLP